MRSSILLITLSDLEDAADTFSTIDFFIQKRVLLNLSLPFADHLTTEENKSVIDLLYILSSQNQVKLLLLNLMFYLRIKFDVDCVYR